MIDPVLYWIASLCLGVLWLGAALGKWRAGREFQQVLGAYKLLPLGLVPAVALLLPLLELCLALGLIVPVMQRLAASLSAVLLLAYALAMAINLLRGRIHIDCGCSLGKKQAISWWLVTRNCALSSVSLGLLLPLTERQWHLEDAVITLLVAVFICVAYPAVIMIIGNSNSLVSGVKQ